MKSQFISCRATKNEKEIFYQQILKICKQSIFKDYNGNLIINDTKKAKILLISHYDTKVNTLLELFINFANGRKNYLNVNLKSLMILILFILSYLFLLFKALLFIQPQHIFVNLMLSILISIISVIPFKFNRNPNNFNDNLSGIEICLHFIENTNYSIILLDDEEKGLKGSNKFIQENKSIIREQLIINLDTVGSGEYIVLSAFNQMERIANLLANNKKYPNIILASDSIKRKGDHWSFREYNCIGISRADKDSKGRLYAKNIHTKYDDENNISQEKLDEVEELVKDIIKLWSEFE